MSVERSSGQQHHVDTHQADALQETRFDANRGGVRQPQVQHRGQYGGCHYQAHPHRTDRPQQRLPIKPRLPPSRQRRMQAQLGEETMDDMTDMDDQGRDPSGHDSPFESFRPAGTSGGRGRDEGGDDNPQGGFGGRGASFRFPLAAATLKPDDAPLPTYKYKLGPKREHPNVGARLMGMNIPGAAILFGLIALGKGPGQINDTLGSLQAVMLSTIRSGTGFAANAPSLSRVAMTGSLTILTGEPSSTVSSYSMGDCKALSQASVYSAWKEYRLSREASEVARDWAALMPLLTFNTQKPRTPGAHLQAMVGLSAQLRAGI